MIYYSTVNLVGWTFGHILKRRVISDTIQDDRRSITATDATIVETYAFQNASAFQLQAMRDEFEKFHLELEAVEEPLSFGEFGTFLRSLQPPPGAN
jgi:hypothetical protein